MAIKEIFYKNEKFAVAYDIIAPRQSANKAAFFLQRSTMAREEGREVSFWGAGEAAKVGGGSVGGETGGIGGVGDSSSNGGGFGTSGFGGGEVAVAVGENVKTEFDGEFGGDKVGQGELKTGEAVGGLSQDDASQRGLIGGGVGKSVAGGEVMAVGENDKGEFAQNERGGEFVKTEFSGGVSKSGFGGGEVAVAVGENVKTEFDGEFGGQVGKNAFGTSGLSGLSHGEAQNEGGEAQSELPRGDETSLSHESQPAQKLQKPNLNFATSQNEVSAAANGAELHCGWGIDRAEWLQRTAALNGERGAAAGDLSEKLAQNEELQKPEMTPAPTAETQNGSQTASEFVPKPRGEFRSVVGGGDLASAVAGDLAFNGVGVASLPACGESCVGGYAFNGKAFELGLSLRAEGEEPQELKANLAAKGCESLAGLASVAGGEVAAAVGGSVAAVGENVKTEFEAEFGGGEDGRGNASQRGLIGKSGFNTGESNGRASAVGEFGEFKKQSGQASGEFDQDDGSQRGLIGGEFGKSAAIGEVAAVGKNNNSKFTQSDQSSEFVKTEFGGSFSGGGSSNGGKFGVSDSGGGKVAAAVGENVKTEFDKAGFDGEFGGQVGKNAFGASGLSVLSHGVAQNEGGGAQSEFSRGEETSLSRETQPAQKLQKPNLNFATSQNESQNETPKSHAASVCKTQSKTPIILVLHGWGASRGLMKMAFKGRLDGFKQIYVDLAGFGKSTAPFALKTQDYANILQIFLNEIGVNVDCVIGHSFGGKVGVLLNPPSLVLLSSAGILVKKSLKIRLKISLFKGLKVFGLGKFYKKFASKDASNLNQIMYETFKNVVDEDFSEKFANFENKALIFWGKGDLQTPLSSGEKIHFLIKNSQFYPLDGDHFFFLTHTEFIGDKIVEFLTCETECENSQISYNTLGEAK